MRCAIFAIASVLFQRSTQSWHTDPEQVLWKKHNWTRG